MASPSEPEPVKFFVAIFFSDKELLLKAKENLINEYGEIDFER